jgi:CHAT domain-containing protein
VLNQRLKGQHQIPATSSLDKLLRAAQASHTVILSYWLAPHRSLVWVIAGGRLRYFELPPRDVIAKQVATYSQSVQQAEDPLAGGGAAGGALYDELLGKAQALIPPGANVIVIPDGELHQLNFETLIVSKPQPHYWIEDIAGVSVAPSLRVLTGEFRKQPRAPKLLLIGNPVQASKDYSALPNASREVAAVEAHFPPGQTVLTGAAAVPACYAKSANDSFTTIHFSAHATANYESPLNSAIILSPEGDKYMLFAREAAGVHVGADLVTVSACRSAGSKAYAGEGLMGFAWAFLGAGARHVIAGLWDLDEAAAVPLMDRLYAEMAAGQTPARALHAAKLALIRSSGRHQRPYFWGPLEVFTRGLGN